MCLRWKRTKERSAWRQVQDWLKRKNNTAAAPPPIDFQLPAAEPADFNFTLDVQDGSLILERQGREMQFEKH
jgi:hypothetical protein